MTSTASALGSTVVVFGCGGVGLFAIQGARLVGARRIIAVDAGVQAGIRQGISAPPIPWNAKDDPVAAVRNWSGGGGADYSFEVTGKTAVMEQAYAATRRGGTVCVIGVGSYTESFPSMPAPFPPMQKRSSAACTATPTSRWTCPICWNSIWPSVWIWTR
ncbi:MAG: zinc-binding dehydrogenase [Gammaproteobacteria bacterium]|nr:zinc-binding dehydrogenase [Gammaproteobacteria bacterium]